MGGPLINLADQRFGRWLVLERAPDDANGCSSWLCRCNCGVKRTIRSNQLRDGRSQSCGCLHHEMMKGLQRRLTHGHSVNRRSNRTHESWVDMRARCSNPNKRFFKHYGGRGITVCERWLNSFENFLADMGERPPGLTIDRIDYNGNYEPGNCRWGTAEQQGRGRRGVNSTNKKQNLF
jgi:hypothetical protein